MGDPNKHIVQGAPALLKHELTAMFEEKASSGQLSLDDIQRLTAAVAGDEARHEENEILISNGSVAGQQDRGQDAVRSQQDRAAQDKEATRKSREWVSFLEMLNNGGLPAYLAAAVFDDMSDDDITALVADIEEQTGRPFEAYARDILGDDMPERIPGESEADYQRRVLKDLTEEMLNPDGTIKAQYKDDPLAQYLAQQDVVRDAQVQAKDIQARAEAEGVTVELVEETEELAADSYGVADVTQTTVEDDTLKMTARDGQDTHRIDEASADISADDNAGELAALFGPAALGETEPVQVADNTVEPETPIRNSGISPV